MPTYCTCGAPLPEDARFCHRCGKPQREEAIEIEPAAPPVVIPLIAPTAEPARVTFNNPMVLRTSLLVASLTTVLELIPFVGFVAPVLGGFASVSLYQYRSGQLLTPGAGAKLAWLTAIFNSVLFTIWTSLALSVNGSGMFDKLREQMRLQATSAAQQQAVQMMNDPVFLGAMVLLAWLFLFALCSVLYMAGGALGARFSKPKTT